MISLVFFAATPPQHQNALVLRLQSPYRNTCNIRCCGPQHRKIFMTTPGVVDNLTPKGDGNGNA